LDYHKTFENYCDAKKGFFDMIPATGFAIANIDDERGQYMLSTTQAHTYTLSLKKSADFNERLDTKLIGEFNAYNVLGIYAIAILLGQDKDRVKEIIKTLETVPGRFQYVKSTNGITGIIDYAHKPDALENVLKTANLMKGNHKLITIVGCGGDRDRGKRPIMAKIGYDMSDILILTSDNPRSEKPEEILAEMHVGIEDLPQDKVYMIVDRHEAIAKACALALSNDFILVAGKGHENYQEINGIKHHFDDLEELEKNLK
jgi:UDP-N-acetylmuramoyl-L-alanyl-D-glutamate--2,6-diaminopimelate ligase